MTEFTMDGEMYETLSIIVGAFNQQEACWLDEFIDVTQLETNGLVTISGPFVYATDKGIEFCKGRLWEREQDKTAESILGCALNWLDSGDMPPEPAVCWADWFSCATKQELQGGYAESMLG